MHYIFQIIKRNRWIFIGLIVGGLLLYMPTPEGLSIMGMRAIVIMVVSIIFFIAEPLPLPGVALLIAVAEVISGIAGPTETARSFMSDSVFFIMGSLMIAAAIVKQKMDKRIALYLLRLTGSGVGRITFGLVAVSALVSSFIGQHAVAAMMLPVGMTLINMISEDTSKKRNLSALILLSIAYGALIGSNGTPSSGASNAIMLNFWNEMFDIKVGYLKWMAYSYPLILFQVPIFVWILLRTFRPEVSEIPQAVEKLKERIRKEGDMTPSEYWVIGILLFTVILWVAVGDRIGLGITSFIGVSLYLMTGLVRWEDLNNGINWGIILIYASTISLGLNIKDTGAGEWMAKSFLELISPLGIDSGIPLLAAISILTIILASVISSGAVVGLLGPIVLNMAQITDKSILAAGFVTAISSSFAYMAVAASPACNIVYSSGYLKTSDFLRGGWKMIIVSILFLLFMASTYWRLIGI